MLLAMVSSAGVGSVPRADFPHIQVLSTRLGVGSSDRAAQAPFCRSISTISVFSSRLGFHLDSRAIQCFAAAADVSCDKHRFLASRRCFLSSAFLLASISLQKSNVALAEIPPGFKVYEDVFEGYSFAYPGAWFQVRGAGASAFFRNPVNLDENVTVDISSPSSSRFKGVEDLGSPEDAAERVLKQYLTEFMSTRLGVRRESNIVSTSSRIGEDGKLFYEVQVNVKSFANNNQMAVMPQDRVAQLEWSRRYLSVLGVENNRLYQLRLQAPENALEKEQRDLREIMDSFRLKKLTT